MYEDVPLDPYPSFIWQILNQILKCRQVNFLFLTPDKAALRIKMLIVYASP